VRSATLVQRFGDMADRCRSRPHQVLAMPAAIPTIDDSFARLHAAGWSVGDVWILAPAGEVPGWPDP